MYIDTVLVFLGIVHLLILKVKLIFHDDIRPLYTKRKLKLSGAIYKTINNLDLLIEHTFLQSLV